MAAAELVRRGCGSNFPRVRLAVVVRSQVRAASTTQADYEWRLRKHLLPFFADFRVSALTIALVDEYRSDKVIERERIKAAAAVGRRSVTSADSGA